MISFSVSEIPCVINFSKKARLYDFQSVIFKIAMQFEIVLNILKEADIQNKQIRMNTV